MFGGSGSKMIADKEKRPRDAIAGDKDQMMLWLE